MSRYMIQPKYVSLTTLFGSFILVFMLLMLPFYLARELGWGWVDAHLAELIVCLAIPSFAVAFWIARWVERKQSEEWVEIDDEGVTSTMRTRPHSQTARSGRAGNGSPQALAVAGRRGPQRVAWQDVCAVELRSRRSARRPGTRYQVCLITDDDVLPIPLNDEVVGTRPMVAVDSQGQPLAIQDVGPYPGMPIVRSVHARVSHVPWVVKEVFEGKYDHREKLLAFAGIEAPWSGETIRESRPGGGRRRKAFVLAAVVAVLISMIIAGFLVWHRLGAAKREREDAYRKARAEAEKERKATEQSAP